MDTQFCGTKEAHPMGEYATLPSVRLASRPAASSRLAGQLPNLTLDSLQLRFLG
jgi:hypothetical protein